MGRLNECCPWGELLGLAAGFLEGNGWLKGRDCMGEILMEMLGWRDIERRFAQRY